MIAFKTFSQAPEDQRPEGTPLDWPWLESPVTTEQESIALQEAGYTVMTDDDYQAYKIKVSPQLRMEIVIEDAMEFGIALMREYGAKNVLRGYTVEQVTQVSSDLVTLQQLCMSGSLFCALTFVENFTPTSLITQADKDYFSSKLKSYLGIST